MESLKKIIYWSLFLSSVIVVLIVSKNTNPDLKKNDAGSVELNKLDAPTVAYPRTMIFTSDSTWIPITTGALNPDITQDNIKDNICAGNAWSTKSIRPPVSYTNKVKLKLLKTTYATTTPPQMFELDHLISLELGGNPTSEYNLWPEPYCVEGKPCTANSKEATLDPYGAKKKDLTEHALHKAVCAGKMTLNEAQQIVVTDWYEYYYKILEGHLGSEPEYSDTDD